MYFRWPLPALLLIAASAPSLAAPATSEGAKAIEQGYVDYFSKAVVEKGIVSVAPKGEDYVVTLDLQKALDLLTSPAQGGLRIERFSYTLTPGAAGSWTAKADRLPSVAFDAPTEKGRVTGTVDLNGFHLDAAFDAAAATFLHAFAGADALAAKFHVAAPPQSMDIDLGESGISAEMRAKTSESGQGVDVAIAHFVKSIAETVVATPSSGDGAPIKVTYQADGVAGGLAISGLRAREIAEFWKYVVAHIDDAKAPADLKQRVRATLPLWNDIHANAEIHDLALQTPVMEATLKMLGETLGLTGFTSQGAAEVGVKIDQLTFKSPLLPPWAEQLSPVSLSLDLRVAGEGLDKAAQLALDDPGFGEAGELSPQTQDAIGETLIAGHPKVVLAPGRLTTPVIDLAFEGETTTDSGPPRGRFTLSADGLDKSIALIEDIAKDDPDMQTVLLAVTFVKGLATTGADGRLVWKIDLTETGDVTVNGTPLPTGK